MTKSVISIDGIVQHEAKIVINKENIRYQNFKFIFAEKTKSKLTMKNVLTKDLIVIKKDMKEERNINVNNLQFIFFQLPKAGYHVQTLE